MNTLQEKINQEIALKNCLSDQQSVRFFRACCEHKLNITLDE